ncbi:Alpha/Beta hydrolase protein [Rhodocollybia butyracea]|uniref:Alpha/Beta hydrolase protein n=1 Tax=Rhodocollybia butyracea TaxID=206335 RepID=A0A9P5UGT8_9AGAR|nr:Alpha/Beta hydrolase protein [Rhodocollybia butyracea]
MPFVQVKTKNGQIKFHYFISTPKSEASEKIDPNLPVLLWFHSLAFPHVFHSQFADPLLRKFNLVVFDMRSHGKTEGDDMPEGYGIVEAAEDALAFMDALNLPPCHFVAMDYGSPIALQIAVAHPARVLSLFFISQTCLKEPPEVREGHQQVYDCWVSAFPHPDKFDNEHMVEGAYGFAQFMFSNNLSNLATAMFNLSFVLAQNHWGYTGLRNYRISTLEFLFNRKSPTKAALSHVRCPVEIVYGTDDVAYRQSYTEGFLENLKDAGVDVSLHVVQGAPHFANVDYPGQVDPALHDFVLRNDDRNPPPVTGPVQSPWDETLRSVGWDPEGLNDDSDDEDFVVTYVSFAEFMLLRILKKHPIAFVRLM